MSGGDVRNADLILALEHPRVWGALNSMTDQLERTSRSHLRPGAKVVTITATDLFTRSNYQDFQRFQEVDLAIAADATVTLPSLVEAVKRFANGNRRNFFEDRGRKVAAANEAARERQRQAAVYEWDLSPVSLTRINYELWEIIKDKDWVPGEQRAGKEPLELHQALSADRRFGRGRRGVRSAGFCRSCAGQQEAWPALHQHTE